MKKIFPILAFLFPATLFAQNLVLKSDVTGKNYITQFPIIRQYFPAQGITSTATTLTNFPVAALDSTQLYLTTANPYPGGGTKFGGIGFTGPVASALDSFLVTAPFGVLCGSSFSASHSAPWHHWSRLETPNGGTAFQYNYIDSVGTLAYYLRQLTGYRWYPNAIGGQSTYQMRLRWARDVLGQAINTTLDGRGPQTLTRRPYIVFFDGVGNDPSTGGNTPQGTINNLIYMAQSCQENGIRFICCISVTTPGVSVAFDIYDQTVNKFLEQGGLDRFGAVIFDMRRFWSNPAMGYDGVNGNPNYINQTDFTHYTSGQGGASAGYDTLAIALINQCRIPVLTKIVFNTNNNPNTGLTNWNYITSATIDGQLYSSLTQNDTFPLLQPLGNGHGTGGTSYDCGDSVWVTPKTVGVGGGSTNNYYLGYMAYYLTNTTSDQDTTITYTRRTIGSAGANNTNLDASSLRIQPENNNSITAPLIQVLNRTVSGDAFDVLSSGTSYALINGATRSALETLNTNGDINTNAHSVLSTGANSEFGLLQVGATAKITTFSQGIGTVNSLIALQGTGNNNNAPIFSFNTFNTVPPGVSGTSLDVGQFSDSMSFGNSSGQSDTTTKWLSKPFVSDTITSRTPNWIGGFRQQYNVANLGVDRLFSQIANRGDNIFNYEGERTGFGTISPDLSTIVDIEDTAKGFHLSSGTTAQRNNIGAITVAVTGGGSGYGSTPPKVVFTGGSGKNARAYAVLSGGAVTAIVVLDGQGYGGSLPSISLVNTAGTGATFTVSLAIKDGILFHNTTVDSLQQWRSTCSCWLDLDYAGAYTSGTYTATVTTVVNCTAPSGGVGHYIKVGNQVTVDVPVAVGITVSGLATEFYVSLPIPSNITSATDLIGNGTSVDVLTVGLGIGGNTTNHVADVTCTPTGTGSNNFYLHFAYTID